MKLRLKATIKKQAGWWNMGQSGGISGIFDEPHEKRNLVMGDSPADTLGEFLDNHGCLDDDGGTIESCPFTRQQLLDFLVKGGPAPAGLEEDFQRLHEDLCEDWQHGWDRNPYPEELQGCIDFCWSN